MRREGKACGGLTLPDTGELSLGVARTASADAQILRLIIQDGRSGELGHSQDSTAWERRDPMGRSDKPTLVLSSLLVGRAGTGNSNPGQHLLPSNLEREDQPQLPAQPAVI